MASNDPPPKKGPSMSSLAEKPKAAHALAERFERMVEEQKSKLSKEEFHKAEENFERIVNKVRASRGRRRETA
jgi:hypothetical protein